MTNYEELYEDIKNMLSEERFKHSERVVKRAIEYAKIYNVDIEMVKLVAISHDIAKELSEEENQKYISKYNIKLDDIEKVNKSLLHAKIGAYICKEKYGFTEDMVNSVRYHTTGRENMSILEKIIYLADATEESRNYNTEEYARYVREDIDNGMVQVSKWVIEKLAKSETPIHIDTIKCYNYYINKKKGVH
jgi:predicted HD superfamily hydrolase involved in NAD metabolism